MAGARPLEEEAAAIQNEVAPDRPELGHTLNILGVVYQSMGDYAAAERTYEQVRVVLARHAG